MTIFLTILLVLAILVFLLLFLALIVNKHYVIEREIVINVSKASVFDYIKKLKNQEYYSIWVMRDPTNQITYHGIDGTVGFIEKWEGQKQAGKGEQEIISLVEDNSIHIEMRFEKPFKNVGQTYMIASDYAENQTLLKWKMEGKNQFPFSLFNLIIDGCLARIWKKASSI